MKHQRTAPLIPMNQRRPSVFDALRRAVSALEQKVVAAQDILPPDTIRNLTEWRKEVASRLRGAAESVRPKAKKD